MNSGLDPFILQKLTAFSQRRRKLIVMRGIAAAIAALLASMMIVALVDRFFVLDDWVRWILSGIAYVAVIVIEWRACLRLLLHAPDPRHLARLVEHAEPQLREDLISAVELGQGDAAMDSEQFRRLVQSDVATRLEGVDVDRLLPVQLLRRTLTLACVIVAVCVVAFLASGFQFGTLLMRAMLPMANLARVSKVKVNIVEPAPADTIAAQGDTVPLIIEISGQRTSKAVLETFTKDGGREIVPMTPTGPDRFTAAIQVARDDVSYRVRAGDALTRKYQLRAAARPHVVSFQKTFQYPAYSKLPDSVVMDDGGDLVGLEGSEVDLRLTTDQAVKTAELIIEQGKQVSTIPLKRGEGGSLGATVSLSSPGIYRVHLVAESTGFENKFSPEYEIRAEPDLVPQIELELPKRDLIVPTNEVVDIRATASDDLGLAKIFQLVRINEGSWKEFKFEIAEGKAATVERRWDLYDQGFKAGDLVTTKLVAVDLKGNRSESRPIRLSIIASGFESKRLTFLDSLRQLQTSLKAQRSAAETLEKRANESREQMERLASDDPLRKQAAASLSNSLEEFTRIASTTSSLLNTTLRTATPGHATGELLMLARLLGRMAPGSSQNAVDLVRVLTGNENAEYARDLVREAAEASSRSTQRARLADDSGRVFVTSEAIDVLNENIQVVAREQERIASLVQPAADDPEKWRQVIVRMRVVLAQVKGLEELMTAGAEIGTDNVPDRLRKMAKELGKQRDLVDRALEKPDARMELANPIAVLTRTITEIRRNAFDLKRDYMGPPARGFQTMLQDVQPTWANFEKLRNEAETIYRNAKVPVETRNDLMQSRWTAKSNVLKAHGDAEESRPDSDSYFVSDIRATTLALGGLRDSVLLGAKPFKEGEAPVASYNTLDQSFRLLEGSHNLMEAYDGLMRLATSERWEVTALRARTANPRDWEWLEARLRSSPDELGKLQIKDETTRKAIAVAQKILWEAQKDAAWRNVNEEMKQRMRPEASPRAVPQDAERVAAFVKQAIDTLRAPVDEARKVVAQLSPKLSEMMSQLAKEAQKLKEHSEEQASKADEKKLEETKAEAKEQLAQQRELNNKLDAVKDALRSDANKQEMFQADGRERARDADDALAMLKEPPPKAEDALNEATMAEQSADQKSALAQASKQQEKLADALNKLADHYKALDEGKPEQTRTALRDSEKELGTKEALDERYAKAETLAQMADSSPEEILKQLEKALPENPQMQQELSSISKNTLTGASEKLSDATQRESAVSQQLTKLAQEQQAKAALAAQQNSNPPTPQPPTQAVAGEKQPGTNEPQVPAQPPAAAPTPAAPGAPQSKPADANAQMAQNSTTPPSPAGQAQAPAMQDPQIAQAASQQTPIARAANEAGEDIARAGRHEQRLQNKATGERLEKLGTEIQETATNEVAKAQQSLASAQMAAQSQGAVDAAKAELQHESGELAAAQSTSPMQAAEASANQSPASAPKTDQSNAAPAAPMSAPAAPTPNAQASNSTAPTLGDASKPAQAASSPSSAQSSPADAAKQAASAPQAAPPSAQGTSPSIQPGDPSMAGMTHPPMGPIAAPQLGGIPKPGSGPATPQEQVWMARTLDALDSALHASAQSQEKPSNQPSQQQGQSQQGQSPAGQNQQQAQSDAMAQAKQAMASAAQAAAAAARAARSQESQMKQTPSSEVAQGDQQSKSETGATADAGNLSHGALPNAQTSRTGDWGKLPKKVAEQLSQGQRETVAGEYRNQVETYYRVIAEKAKKQ